MSFGTLLILYSQDDNITSDTLTRDIHLQLTRYQMTDPRRYMYDTYYDISRSDIMLETQPTTDWWNMLVLLTTHTVMYKLRLHYIYTSQDDRL